MGNDELLNYISLFREKAEQGKLVIFVGAGVSCNVDGMPSWNKLIQNMAKAINYSRCNSCRHKAENCESTCLVKDDFSIDEFLKIPQHVFNKDKELYNRVLAESIPIVTADAPLSSAIFDVNPAHIITTNYDKLLESSKNIFCEQYQVIVHDKDLLNANKGKYIIKMHGDISEASSIVLKEQDYLDYSQTHVLIELFSTLSNIVLLLNLVGLDCDGKKTIAASIEELLSDEIFVQKFFSIGWPDFKQSLREFSKLCCSLTFSSNFELIYQIVDGEKFFEYAVNVSFNSLRHLIEQFISKDEETTDKIQALIDATENFNSKVILLRLLYRRITGDATQQKYKRILSDSFAQLPIGAIYDFAFSGWLTPNQDALKEFLNRILEISKKGNSNMRVFPDPVETKLECVYLLHISDMLADISMLKPLSEGRPHLQFLLDPKNFDYSQVDFSDYMWENFARREEYMKTFVAHKEVIIPKIQKRIETGEVTEAEKRILYGFLLRGDEVWKM